tara:strand:+ start:4743 stop:5549 length:807 start_codon:yes stop_codon:yes gene_type:complete
MTVKLRLTKTEINQLKKGEAVEILKDLGLSSDGNRAELQSRIRTHYYDSKKSKLDSTTKTEKTPVETKTKIPSKSAIRLMKKGDITKKLQEFCLPTDGNKDILVNRLEDYYRPNKNSQEKKTKDKPKNKKNTENVSLINSLNSSIPTKANIRKMSNEQLRKNLLKLGLSTEGACIELSMRLSEHYHPTSSSNISDVLHLSPCIKPADYTDKSDSNSNTTEILVIEYDGRKIGVTAKGLRILERNEDEEDTWKKTNLFWNLETGAPYGF